MIRRSTGQTLVLMAGGVSHTWGVFVLWCWGMVVILEQMADLVCSEHVVCRIICVQLLGACLGICVKDKR